MGIAGWIRLGAYSGTVDDVEAQPVLLREAALIDQPSAGTLTSMRMLSRLDPGVCARGR